VRILGFGTYDKSVHPRVGVLLAGLEGLGDRVVEVNAPLGLSTADRVQMLRRPWRAYRLVGRLLSRWLRLVRLARVQLRTDVPEAVIVGYLGHFDVLLARLLFRRQIVMLDCLIFARETAIDRGVQGDLILRAMAAIDSVAVRCANVVLVDTDEHLAMVPPRYRGRGLVVPVGAPEAWFAARPRPLRPSDGPLRVVFFGLFTPLHGTEVIGRALALLGDDCDIRVTMIGQGQDWESCRAIAAANRRVEWREWVDSESLPRLVADHHVCLGIFGVTDKARRVVPNKVFQGAAAGCAILTSDTEPQRRVLGDGAEYVEPGDADGLAAALCRLAERRERVDRLRRAAIQTAQQFHPTEVARPVHELLIPREAATSRT
jgi:glycosyltransferase involved in cell wall biosynthesis